MKAIYSIILLFCFNFLQAQIGIGIQDVRGASILDFGKNQINGIVLPYNETTNNAVNGTIRVDKTTNKVQYYNGFNWIDLTDSGQIPANMYINNNDEAADTQGVVISDTGDAQAPGVLVLESTNKALTLPHIDNPHLTIVDPPIGMMCYDTVSKTIAIFNGLEWYFYK